MSIISKKPDLGKNGIPAQIAVIIFLAEFVFYLCQFLFQFFDFYFIGFCLDLLFEGFLFFFQLFDFPHRFIVIALADFWFRFLRCLIGGVSFGIFIQSVSFWVFIRAAGFGVFVWGVEMDFCLSVFPLFYPVAPRRFMFFLWEVFVFIWFCGVIGFFCFYVPDLGFGCMYF